MKKKKSIILLIILLVIIFGMILIPKIEEKKEPNHDKTSGDSISIESLIQDANYTYDASGSYLFEDEEYSLKNIVLPYFLADTEDAKNANEQVKALYQVLAKDFQSELNGSQATIIEAWYDVMRVKGMLSVNITVQRKNKEKETMEYYPYVFDLENLKRLDYWGQVEKLEISKKDLEEKVEKAIRNLGDFKNLKEEDCPEGKTPEDYVNDTIKIYQDLTKNGVISSYVDAVSRINILMNIALPNASENTQRIIIVK